MNGFGQMRILGAMLIAAGAILAANTTVQAQDPPFFTAFKTFCVDTGVRPSAVGAAVLAAGGVPHGHGSTDDYFPMTTSSWDVTVRGHRMVVTAGRGYPSRKFKDLFDLENCHVEGVGGDYSSIGAIDALVGVPARWCHVPTTCMFGYRASGSIREPVTSFTDQLAAEKRGEYWMFAVEMDSDGATVGLTHFLLPAASSSSTRH